VCQGVLVTLTCFAVGALFHALTGRHAFI
jgi:hypothetical protein